MFSKLGIGKRLVLAFGTIVVILALSVGIAFLGFRSLRTALAEVKDQSAQIVLAKDAQSHVLNVMTHLGAVAASEETSVQQVYLADIASDREGYKTNLELLKAKASTAETKKLIADVEAAIGSSRETNNEVLELAKAKKNAEAVKIYSAIAVPKLKLWTDAFDSLNAKRQALMDESLQQAETRIQRSTLILLSAGLIAILLAVTLGWIITRSIVRPIRGFMDVLGALAGGDLTREAKVDSHDEIGQLGISLNQALLKLREAMREVSGASMTVSSGAIELSASSDQMSTTTHEIAKSGELLHGATAPSLMLALPSGR